MSLSRSILLGKNREPPPLPFSPISNLSPPSHKRPRMASWQPPPHVPDFLPPFPTTVDNPPSPVLISSPKPDQSKPLPAPAVDAKVEKHLLTLAQTITSSSSASDYLVQVPYSQSSLSGVAEWHLPSAQPASNAMPLRQTRLPTLPTPQTEQALFTAYHHILTHPPLSNGTAPTPSRHRVAMALLSQIQTTPRWEPPDTLYSSVAPCPPRVSTIGPTYPMALAGDVGSDSKVKTEKDVKFPPTVPRPVSSSERLTPLISQQASRIPDLARHALPVS
jgi:Wiskott-Aldrich syndrome protein